jgi:hypothetical protein
LGPFPPGVKTSKPKTTKLRASDRAVPTSLERAKSTGRRSTGTALSSAVERSGVRSTQSTGSQRLDRQLSNGGAARAGEAQSRPRRARNSIVVAGMSGTGLAKLKARGFQTEGRQKAASLRVCSDFARPGEWGSNKPAVWHA